MQPALRVELVGLKPLLLKLRDGGGAGARMACVLQSGSRHCLFAERAVLVLRSQSAGGLQGQWACLGCR